MKHFKRLVLFVLLIFTLHQPFKIEAAYYRDLTSILAEVRRIVRDTNSSNYRWTDAILTERTNAIQNYVCVKTLCVQGRTYLTTTASTREVSISSDCLAILRAAYYITGSTEAYKKLIWTSIGGQDYQSNTWQNFGEGLPTEYYKRAGYIGLKPVPSSTYAGSNKIQLDYSVMASSLTSGTDIPFNSEVYLYPYHDALVYGVAALCFWDMGNINDFTIAEAKFKDIVDTMKSVVAIEPDKNPNMVR